MSAVVQISAGTGPVEVRRFVALLAEHLAARCEQGGAVLREVVVHGDEEAPASVELHLAAAPPWVSGLAGTHALVARSPDRGKRARKRWYAGVRLCEAQSGGARAAVRREDVTITAMRASGPGGQKVNKTASAVRVHHAASGITVRVADERGAYAVVGSQGGAPTNPQWVHNLRAQPIARLQDGADVVDFTVREVEGDEKAEWWARGVAVWPDYDAYQAATDRAIPVFVLEPQA